MGIFVRPSIFTCLSRPIPYITISISIISLTYIKFMGISVKQENSQGPFLQFHTYTISISIISLTYIKFMGRFII